MKTFLTLTIATILSSCTAPVATPTNLSGVKFPQVQGSTLKDEAVVIPDSFLGKPTVLLVGYKQKTQFDIDRWILGILQADIQVKIVEVPTIAGMMPEMVQGFINGGMRSGIPTEDWASVVTVYGDADKIIEAIGNDRPQSAHVVLLDKNGSIVWSSNRGYSAQQVLELKKVVATL